MLRPIALFSATLAASLWFTPAFAADCIYAPDADGDGHRAIACGGDDCSDKDARRYPGAVEVCDSGGLDEDCNYDTPGFRDADEDGFNDATCVNKDTGGTVRSKGNDCDDSQPGVHRIATEVCNGIDDDCDGAIDEGLTLEYFDDDDGDGFGTGTGDMLCPQDAEGLARRAGDCDDTDPAVIPGAQICDGRSAVDICQADGTWLKTACAGGWNICKDQPNQLGVCRFNNWRWIRAHKASH